VWGWEGLHSLDIDLDGIVTVPFVATVLVHFALFIRIFFLQVYF
jgi:hypothetical protein